MALTVQVSTLLVPVEVISSYRNWFHIWPSTVPSLVPPATGASWNLITQANRTSLTTLLWKKGQ